jgi:hypothetical protein
MKKLLALLALWFLVCPHLASGETLASKSIKCILVDKMANDLDPYIRAEITKKFKGRALVVMQ